MPDALSAGSSPQRPKMELAIWPTGPEPGVYVTTSQDAINALLAKYEEASDGAIVYGEHAARDCDACIDLGDDGL